MTDSRAWEAAPGRGDSGEGLMGTECACVLGVQSGGGCQEKGVEWDGREKAGVRVGRASLDTERTQASPLNSGSRVSLGQRTDKY